MANYKLIAFDKIPSTQTYAHEMIANGTAADHVAIVARAQSAGRGRYCRKWVSHHGNLYVSFIFRRNGYDSRISYAVAVAVAETLLHFGVQPTIKWPNDILVDGAKICGILIEYSGDWIIVGIGINIKTNPTVENYKTTRMDKYCNVTSVELLSRLMIELDKWMGIDFADVRVRWMSLAANIGKMIKFRGNDARMLEISPDGGLVLCNANGKFTIFGDEISV